MSHTVGHHSNVKMAEMFKSSLYPTLHENASKGASQDSGAQEIAQPGAILDPRIDILQIGKNLDKKQTFRTIHWLVPEQ